MFLKLENTVKYVDADSVDDLKLSKEVPIGVWKLSCAQYVGFYLEDDFSVDFCKTDCHTGDTERSAAAIIADRR